MSQPTPIHYEVRLEPRLSTFQFTGRVVMHLNADFSAKADTVISTEAGAIVGDDLWYEDWTIPGTIVE